MGQLHFESNTNFIHFLSEFDSASVRRQLTLVDRGRMLPAMSLACKADYMV